MDNKKPSERIDEIYENGYEKLDPAMKILVDKNPTAELGLRFDAMMKFLDAEYERNKIDNSGSL